jgi:hypothetical protein
MQIIVQPTRRHILCGNPAPSLAGLFVLDLLRSNATAQFRSFNAQCDGRSVGDVRESV